jgi:transposase
MIRSKNFQLPFEKGTPVFISADANCRALKFFDEEIKNLELQVRAKFKGNKDYRLLTNTPGIGVILALTILLESGPIERFKSVGNYVSYCRLVMSLRESNGKKKGEGNRKAGNKYLSWAYSEAAHFMLRTSKKASSFYERKKQKKNGIVAIRALAHKIARAVYHMLKNKQEFNIDRVFK